MNEFQWIMDIKLFDFSKGIWYVDMGGLNLGDKVKVVRYMEKHVSWLNKRTHSEKDIKNGDDGYLITDDDSRTNNKRTLFMTGEPYNHNGHREPFSYRDNLQYVSGKELIKIL